MLNLLRDGMNGLVKPTGLSKKLTLAGETKAYPVYQVRLDALYYNDQNDRIATWISQYNSEHGADMLGALKRDQFNDTIECFIVQSNPTAIERTQMNIELVGQREPGVVLSDGRVIDGNRRFTCLRRLHQKDEAFAYFETVILDISLENNRKQIKMLELAIQHGEEKKVDYNPLDILFDEDAAENITARSAEMETSADIRYNIAPRHLDDPDVVCMNINHTITGLTFTLVFSVRKTDYSTNNVVDFAIVMLDEEHKKLADEIVLHGKVDDTIEHSITLAARASGLSKCYVGIRSIDDKRNELQQLIPLAISMMFASDVDF